MPAPRDPTPPRLGSLTFVGGCVLALTLPAFVLWLAPEELGDVRARVMRPYFALGAAALGVALLCLASERSWLTHAGRLLASAAAAIGLAAFLAVDSPLADGPAWLMRAQLARPAFGVLLLLVGISLSLSARSRISVVLAILGLASSAGIGFLGLYDPGRLASSHPPLELTVDGIATALLASLGALLRHRELSFVEAFTASDDAGSTLRRYLAGAALIPTLLGAVALAGGRAGWYDEATRTALFAMGSVLALSGFALASVAGLRRADRERARVAAALAASEARYRHIFDRASVGIAELAADGRWLHANEKLCTMLGYTLAELRERSYGELSHLEDVTLDAQQWEMLRRGDIQDYGVERRFVSKQGEIVHTDVRLVREIDASETLRFIAVLQDITGRKLSEGTLRVYERAIAATQNGIVITDASKPDNPIISVNPAFVEITGFSASDVIGRNCRFLNARAREQPALADLRRALERSESCSVLVLNHRANGEEFWNQLSIAPVHDPDGRLTYWVGTLVDATAAVRALDEREQLLAAARDGRRLAETANDAKDQFLTVISHELRSPMGAILTWTSLLRDECDPENRVRALDAIEASVRAQTRLVDDLLMASRLRTSTIGVEFSNVDLAAGIESIVHRLLPAAREKGVVLELLLSGGKAMCYGDFQRIEQIVHNLVDNAIKFTPAGGRVTVELADDRDRWSVEVRDTGRGLAREDLIHVFEEFWQADRGQPGRKGLGLGLAIVKHLVERHGGSVRAASAGLGLGSTFRFDLPKAAAAGPTPSAKAPSADEDGPMSGLAGVEVVVVEDDPELLEALGAALNKAGAVPRLAATVPTALSFFSGIPDVLISDIGLPDRDGFDLIRFVRSSAEPIRSICALAVSGLAEPGERKRIHRAGFDAFLAKPIEPRAVLRRVVHLRALLADPAPNSLKLLVLGDDRTRDVGLTDVLLDEGHEVRSVEDVHAAWRETLDRRPDAIIVPAWLDGASISALAERLAAMKMRVPFVGLVERDAEREQSHFDFVVPLLDLAMLRRVLRLREEPFR